ncbi:hypothetical protein ACIG47_24090 [Promicromonospora sp. NPDC052451]|uniref:hypothetical protein n=1 Tax=Promicromonospora sp. NPDC052451 TaxID=3364407 RepID=UPI0037C87A91
MQVIAIGGPVGAHPGARRVGRTLGEVVDAVAALRADDVVLTTRDEPARRVARSTRLVLGPERIGVLHVDAPMTAWAVLLAGLCSPGLTASAARAVADEVLSRTTTRVLLSSVASLHRPTPTFRQHAGSYLPRTAFVVDPGRGSTRGTVRRFRGSLGVPDGGDLLVVARSPRPVVPDDDGTLLPRSPDAELVAAEPGWTATRWLEASTVEGSLGAAVATALSRSYLWGACDACGRAVAGACVFCDIAERRVRARTEPPAGTDADTPTGTPTETQGVIS